MSRTIIIVDDDADDRQFFLEALQEIDGTINCICVKNAPQVLELLSKGDAIIPDYIFLDLNMPRINGNQCLIQLRKMKKLDKVPVIIFSTTKRDEEAANVLKSGASLFLTKPARFADLVKNISFILSQHWEKITIE
jgi:DNA-binding response OmpR family regulator